MRSFFVTPQHDIWGKPIETRDPRGSYIRIIVGGEVSELGPYPNADAAVVAANGTFPIGSTYELFRIEDVDGGGLKTRVVARLQVASRCYSS